MTAAQALRYERRQMLAERRRKERIETAKAILALLLILAAFGIAGALDSHDDSAQLAMWQEQGVTVSRW